MAGLAARTIPWAPAPGSYVGPSTCDRFTSALGAGQRVLSYTYYTWAWVAKGGKTNQNRNCQDLSGTVWYCQVLSGTVRCCRVLSGTFRYCLCDSCLHVPVSRYSLSLLVMLYCSGAVRHGAHPVSCGLSVCLQSSPCSPGRWGHGCALFWSVVCSVLCSVLCFVLCSVLCSEL